ncbi:DUF3035 domain-containing protein [Henriciella litoralis]|uniref:DUF3035 domain-containing protein n=1 Tax=Henriciella litoralis TaxID=568102 RepID=UPI00146BC35A|nr:DUF3035 domain-containing protein [Henriciella litoralis]
MRHAFLTTLAMGAILATGGCSLFGNGGGSPGPDEFRVVTKAPLSVPPEYSLRPPEAGTTVPAEADPNRAPVATAFGTTVGADASAAERALVAAAGANATNPAIRSIVDYEESGVVRKARDDANEIIAYSGGSVTADNATGDEQVTIARGSGERIKLPGT